MAVTVLAELAARKRLALLLKMVPQIQQRLEIRILVLPLAVFFIRRLAFVGGTLARVLDTQGRGDHQHFPQCAFVAGRQQHAPEARIEGQTAELDTQRRQLALAVDRAQFAQQLETVADQA